MDELKTKAGDLTDSISDYIQTYYKLTLLNVADKSTTLGASVMAALVVAFLGIFVLLFSGIALGIWLGHLLENEALGYLLVAGLYLLLIVLIVILRKNLVFPFVRNKLINKLYESND